MGVISGVLLSLFLATSYNDVPTKSVPNGFSFRKVSYSAATEMRDDLVKSTVIAIPTPEAVCPYEGTLYVSSHSSGCIYRLENKQPKLVVCTGGLPLGIAAFNSTLYVADAATGLLGVDLTTLKTEILLPAGILAGDNLPLQFPDDVDVDGKGMVYLSNGCGLRPHSQRSPVDASVGCMLGAVGGGGLI